MPDERKPVICPWCGRKMDLFLSDYLYSGKACANYMCRNCSIDAPTAYGDTTTEAIEAAYAAATRTPPNLPLTQEQVEAMPELGAVWEVKHHDDSVWLRTAKYMQSTHPWATKSLFFDSPPTTADIEVARAEKSEGGQ